MGTASSMGAVAEVLGLAWPASTSIPAGDPRHLDVAQAVGARIVELVTSGATASSQVTASSLENALVVLSAIGGSTNAVIHLTAMARRLGLDFTLDDLDRLSRATPVIVDVEPSGTALMEDLDARRWSPERATGPRRPAQPRRRSRRTGPRRRKRSRSPPRLEGVVHDLDAPVDAAGAFRVVRGNLAPDGALIKRSAATPAPARPPRPGLRDGRLRRHRRAHRRRRETVPRMPCWFSPVPARSAGPGMPEWGMIPDPRAAARPRRSPTWSGSPTRA